jgi:hypothetical protein
MSRSSNIPALYRDIWTAAKAFTRSSRSSSMVARSWSTRPCTRDAATHPEINEVGSTAGLLLKQWDRFRLRDGRRVGGPR